MASWKRRKTPLARPYSFPEKTRLGRFLPYVLCALGNVYLQTGRATEAKDILLEAKDKAEALGHGTSVLIASTYLASAYAQLGNPTRGLELARACQAGAKQKGYQTIEALALFAEAVILLFSRRVRRIGCHRPP